MFRFLSHNRSRNEVPDDLMAYSLYDECDDSFSVPPIDKLLEYKYIVCTCTMAGYNIIIL